MAGDFTDQVLVQCGFAMGAGAKMNIKLEAIAVIQQHLRAAFKKKLEGTPTSPVADPAKAWKLRDHFILSCCEEIGRIAAEDAHNLGLIAIGTTQLMDAFNKVAKNNEDSASPGEFCPPYP